MNNSLFLSTLGLARRAGKICRGYDSTTENAHNIYCVFLAKDCSKRTQESISNIFDELNITPIKTDYSKMDLGYAIGTKPVGIIGITDKGFAKLLITRLSKEVTE